MASKWNIIFIAIDTQPGGENQEIEKGIANFETDVLSQVEFLDKDIISIDMLIYQNNAEAGKAIHKKLDITGKNIIDVDAINDFKVFCQRDKDINGYKDFFNKVINANKVENAEQRYIVIFLAHSFGVGFAAFKPEGSNNELFLDSLDLYHGIKKAGFPGNKIDCFVGVNCLIQNTTFNYLFSDAADYIIGSQFSIAGNLISYKKLLEQLTDQPELCSDLFFTKILYDFVNCKKIDDEEDKFDCNRYDCDRVKIYFKNSLSLTKPKIAEEFYNRFHMLVSLIKATPFQSLEVLNVNPDLIAFRGVAFSIADSSANSNKDFFDGFTFFSELGLNEIYKGPKKQKLVQAILEILKQLVVKEIGGFDSIAFNNGKKLTFSFPFGINVFIPNGNADAKQIILKMVIDIHEFKNPVIAKGLINFLETKKNIFVAADGM